MRRILIASGPVLGTILFGVALIGPGSSDSLAQSCDTSYPDFCIPPPPPDLDCSDIPYSHFRVLAPDPHGLDLDEDGYGCDNANPTYPPATATTVVGSAPPSIGMVIYGNAPTGAVLGQTITAAVIDGATSAVCGDGKVIESDGLKFVVRVLASRNATPGCGASGRFVRLTFNSVGGSPARVANPQIPWKVGPVEVNVQLSGALYRLFASQLARTTNIQTPPPDPTPAQTPPTVLPPTATLVAPAATPTAAPPTCQDTTATIVGLNKTGNPETVTISGTGLMTGWYVISEAGNQRFNFPTGYVLNGSVQLQSASAANNNPPSVLLWTNQNIWNNGEDDDAFLYDCLGALRSTFDDGQ